MSKLKRKVKYHDNGRIRYEDFHLNGKLHNENGPAYKEWNENGQLLYKQFRLNGKLHNENGPASREWYVNGCYDEFWLNGKKYTKSEWEKKINKKPKKLYKPWG